MFDHRRLARIYLCHNDSAHFAPLSALLFAGFVQDSLTNSIGLKLVYLFGVTVFGLSMVFTVLFPSVIVLNVCAAFSGVGFAVATTIPGLVAPRCIIFITIACENAKSLDENQSLLLKYNLSIS